MRIIDNLFGSEYLTFSETTADTIRQQTGMHPTEAIREQYPGFDLLEPPFSLSRFKDYRFTELEEAVAKGDLWVCPRERPVISKASRLEVAENADLTWYDIAAAGYVAAMRAENVPVCLITSAYVHGLPGSVDQIIWKSEAPR
jgi:hypothetical protein